MGGFGVRTRTSRICERRSKPHAVKSQTRRKYRSNVGPGHGHVDVMAVRTRGDYSPDWTFRTGRFEVRDRSRTRAEPVFRADVAPPADEQVRQNGRILVPGSGVKF